MFLLSHIHIAPAFAARLANRTTALLSLDLGLTMCEVQVCVDGVGLPGDTMMPWEALREVQEAGFSRVAQRPEAFGLVAYKV